MSINNLFYTESTRANLSLVKKYLNEHKDMLEPRYTLKDLDNTYRQINHWESVGLLDNRRLNNGWRKFSYLDIVYLVLLQQMRDFNFSIEHLVQNFKRGVYAPFDGMSSTSTLEACAFYVFFKGAGNAYLIVDDEANVCFLTMSEFCAWQDLNNVLPSSYILVNVNKLLNEKLKPGIGKGLRISPETLVSLTEPEMKLIEHIRTATNVEQITLHLTKNGDTLVGYTHSESLQNGKSLHEIIDGVKDFGDIHITKRAGKTVDIKATKQEKI